MILHYFDCSHVVTISRHTQCCDCDFDAKKVILKQFVIFVYTDNFMSRLLKTRQLQRVLRLLTPDQYLIHKQFSRIIAIWKMPVNAYIFSIFFARYKYFRFSDSHLGFSTMFPEVTFITLRIPAPGKGVRQI